MPSTLLTSPSDVRYDQKPTMIKIIETTELISGLTSFQTEIETVDTSASLQERYERYRSMLETDSVPAAPSVTTSESAAKG